MNLKNKAYWMDVLVRAIKTGAQAAVALLGTNAVGVLHWDWIGLGSAVLGAMVVSVLTSLASLDNVGSDKSDDTQSVDNPVEESEDADLPADPEDADPDAEPITESDEEDVEA